MNKLLIVVDMQNDFIDGTLGTQEAEHIVHKVVAKITEYEMAGRTIIFTMDTHSDDYPVTSEGKKLPVTHCIKDTPGWQISDAITTSIDLSKYKIYEKNTFGSSELARDLLNGLYDTATSIEIIGLCTDICVISNAMLVKTMLPEIPITVDASCCAGVTPNSHQNALEAMKMCHIEVKNNK
ncbi:amidase [Anaerocolumna cellulosilytica]|uniref:nicotinamidase n=1 Tax=Anaerocolumna cellulosilytica TaxID=433286 RepID=A0A6S6R053_9FIRM|nr:isochorismatase family cysteine hydrolase [Anaerocolumna cellulosilytica]MBB5194522.1 nicotinamidase-related amidase [Anaerocolumna cellulosilytica]BCJ93467.1 amidase [Anaerocolumna cellulosilytica]